MQTILRKALFILGCLFVSFTPAPAQVNLINDGNFYETITTTNLYSVYPGGAFGSWVVTKNSVDVANKNNVWYHGDSYDTDPVIDDQFLDLDGNPGPGEVKQTFSTEVGKTYELSLAYSSNYVDQPDGTTAQVSITSLSGINFSETIFHDSSEEWALDWKIFAKKFVATDTLTTLTLTSLSTVDKWGGIPYGGPLIDAVKVVEVPVHAPEAGSSLLLILTAFLGLTFRRRKKTFI